MIDKMHIYYNLPVGLQNVACSLEGLRIKKQRFGSFFSQKFQEYKQSASLRGEALRNLQNQKLCIMIDHCYQTVPYYRDLFNSLGITNRDIRTIEDLETLPILKRDEVKKHADELVSTAIPLRSRYIHSTGGTTGSGLKFWTTHKEEGEQWAVWWRYRNDIGINREDWCALLNGKVIVQVNQNKPPFWRVNKPGRQVFFSAAHLNVETVGLYAKEMKTRNIRWLHGYPTLIAQFATLVIEKNIDISFDAVTLGSENLTENQENTIRRAFNIKPFQHYGLTEGVANFSQSKDGTMRVDEDFSYVEFIPTEFGTSIVGTTFTNFAMPLIRYDTGDFGVLDENQDGGFRKIKSLDGRASDSIIRKDGSKVSSAAISLIFNTFPEIAQAQIVQKQNTLLVRLVLLDNMGQDRKTELENKFKERTHDDFTIEFQEVESLEKTKNGKARLVIME